MRMIADGMTLPGYLGPIDDKDTPLRFRYRIVNVLNRADFQERLRVVVKAADKETLASKLVAGLVTEWDQVYPPAWPERDKKGESLAGKPVPLTSEVLLTHVHPTTFTRLYNIVTGGGVCDPDPNDSVDSQIKSIERNAMGSDSLAELLDSEDSEQKGN